MRLALALILALAGPCARAGDFDHYLLALSWSPSWCALTGDARGAPACADGAAHGWTLHGLWPQHERGWPEWCDTQAAAPPAAAIAAMADIMGSPTLAGHQWRRHGSCTGLDATSYFALSRAALAGISLPEPGETIRPGALAEAMRVANPGLPQDGLVVTCREGHVVEVRFCLDRDLGFRSCGEDTLARACRGDRPLVVPPPR